jgi:hypothetical protein
MGLIKVTDMTLHQVPNIVPILNQPLESWAILWIRGLLKIWTMIIIMVITIFNKLTDFQSKWITLIQTKLRLAASRGCYFPWIDLAANHAMTRSAMAKILWVHVSTSCLKICNKLLVTVMMNVITIEMRFTHNGYTQIMKSAIIFQL